VKPDVIIHTGDMADEVKVGRMPEVRDEYIEKIAEMAEILNDSGAEKIYIVPGNNDLPDEISRLVPTAQMMKNSWRIEVDGIEGRVGHQVTSINYDKQWAFYGHGYTGETWRYEQNREGGECRFNACNGAFIVSFKDNKYYKVDLPKY
jgi:predicted phosphodiesterase